MEARFNFMKAAPGVDGADARGLEKYLQGCGLEQACSTYQAARFAGERLRVSPWTCTGKICRRAGEKEQRMYSLDAWRECPVLHGTRARGAGLDGGCDADCQRSCARRGCTKRRARISARRKFAI